MSNPPSTLIEKIEKIEEKLKTSKEILKVLEVNQVEEDLTNYLETFSRKLDEITAAALFQNREKLLNGSKDVMQKMIRSCPDSMKYVNKREQLPIQDFVWKTPFIEFITLFAIEGAKHDVGGKEMRGGLLCIDPRDQETRLNSLQLLVRLENTDSPYDINALEALRSLKEANLLKKEDLLDYQLLFLSMTPGCQLRFEFLLSLDRSVLISGMHNDMPFAHATILHDTQDGDLFKMYFEKTFQYCKCNYGGMLFIKNKDDVTAFDVALQKYGKTNLMRMLKGLVPNGSDFRIIHYFAFFAPEYVNMIYKYFREQAKGEDHNGRTLKQLILAGGMSNINYNFYFLDDITKQELYTRDPVTGLFPFAATAVGEDSDVEYSYVLLRKNPKVIDNILLSI